MSHSTDHLYLLEVLVDNVTVASNDDPDIAVQVQFGDIGTFLIKRTSVQCVDPTDVDIADGKCLLFSMRPTQLQSYMFQHPLSIAVIKTSSGDKQCVAKFPWDDSFIAMVSEEGPAEPNAQFDTIDLMDAADEERFVGFVDVLVRLSCHGKNIMSQFQRRFDIRGKHNSCSQDGIYHSDIAPLEPVISTVEIAEGLVLGMLPTDCPVTCVHERAKNPSPELAEHFLPKDVLYEINTEKRATSSTASSSVETQNELIKESLRPCIKSFTPLDCKIQKFLASDPNGFNPLAKEQAMMMAMQRQQKRQRPKSVQLYDPLDHAEMLTSEAVSARRTDRLEKLNRKSDDRMFLSADDDLTDLCKNCGGYGPNSSVPKQEKEVYMTTGGARIAFPPEHFTCQGGGCKAFEKRRNEEYKRTRSRTEPAPCFPVPPCMRFNPCEYPKCLKERPRGFNPCYLPPCPADRASKQMPWVTQHKKSGRKKHPAPSTSTYDSAKEEEDIEEDYEDSVPLTAAGSSTPKKKKNKNKRRRKKCGGVCLSRGLDRYYNPRFRMGHQYCVPELVAEQGVPPNMGWLWNVPNVGIDRKPGWRPGAVHRKVFEIMSQLKNTNYEDQEALRDEFETKKKNESKEREKRQRAMQVQRTELSEVSVEMHNDDAGAILKLGDGKDLESSDQQLAVGNEDMRQHEVMLQKTLTEVCRELCLGAYTDVFVNGLNIDLQRLATDSSRMAANTGNSGSRLTKNTPSVRISGIIRKYSSDEIPSIEYETIVIDDQPPSCKDKGGQIELIQDVPEKDREEDPHRQNEKGKERFITKRGAPTPCHSEEKPENISKEEMMSLILDVVTSSAVSSPRGQDCARPTKSTTHQEKSHKCNRPRHELEARLFDEIDRILHIKEESDACKKLMRRFIEEMEADRLATEDRFSMTETSAITYTSEYPGINSETCEHETKYIIMPMKDPGMHAMKQNLPHKPTEIKVSGTRLTKETPKTVKVEVEAKVSTWLNSRYRTRKSVTSNNKQDGLNKLKITPSKSVTMGSLKQPNRQQKQLPWVDKPNTNPKPKK